jgi:glycosyltransferase involved in cell wall biosynthesis
VKSLALLVPGPIDQLTGGYLYARRLVEGLRAAGVRVAVYELDGRFPDADAAACAACDAVLGRLRDGSVAVIDGLALAGFAGSLARQAQRLRLLALVHHPLADETGIGADAAARFAALERALLPRCAGVICPSAVTAASVAAYGVASERIATVPPGTVKPATPRRARHAGPCHLLSVGTVTPRKGHRVLIAALARIKDRAWRLRLVGSLARDAAEVAALRSAIAAHGLGERVSLEGEWPQDRLDEAYANADLFVLASYHEGYGMAFAEALAHGLPIVATAGGAIAETVPEAASLLVPPGDDAALAMALARAIDDAALRARLGAASASAGRALPDWSEAVRRWLDAARRLAA